MLADMPSGHELTVQRKVVKKIDLPPFDCFGGNMELKTKIEGYPNLFKVLKNLSKTATWFWWSLLESRERLTNVCQFQAADAVEARKVSIAYKELHKHDLIVRVRRQYYLINPKAYFPDVNEWETVFARWQQLNCNKENYNVK
jgi:hypothetical protein